MDPKNNRVVLGGLTVICVVLIAVTAIRDSWIAPLRVGVGYVLTPLQIGVNLVGREIYNSVETREKLKTALEDNKALKEQVETLRTENTRLQAESFELQRLRELYQLGEEYGQYQTIAARVIAKDTTGWFRVFRIDKGSAAGIAVDMNVMAGGGLVGIVTDVGSNYATVRTIIDDLSRVSAMAMQSGDTCIISGDINLYREGKLRLSDIMIEGEVRDGDKIITSNVSTKFLPGILIGYATEIKEDESRLTKSGYLLPVANFDTLQEVLIVTDLKQTQE